jgi:hypothetical protein
MKVRTTVSTLALFFVGVAVCYAAAAFIDTGS